jgi:hypothetical protein
MPSTSDLAGALAAIETKLQTEWTTSRVVLDANNPGDNWPPTDSNGELLPWVWLEILDTDASIIGFGTATNRTVLDSGLCKFHVMVPSGTGLSVARAHAVAIGEIGREVSNDEGNWVSMTCTVEYEFYHRA